MSKLFTRLSPGFGNSR